MLDIEDAEKTIRHAVEALKELGFTDVFICAGGAKHAHFAAGEGVACLNAVHGSPSRLGQALFSALDEQPAIRSGIAAALLLRKAGQTADLTIHETTVSTGDPARSAASSNARPPSSAEPEGGARGAET